MLKINRKIEYALIALKHMGEKLPGELTSAKEICNAYRAPFDVMSRVLQILTANKLLKSEHGPHGGYLIQKDLAKVTLYGLSKMLVGLQSVVDCLDDGECSCELIDSCNIVLPISRLSDRMKAFYASISVRELVMPVDSRRGLAKLNGAGAKSNGKPREEFVV